MREVRLENGVRGVDRLNNGEPRHPSEIGLRDPRGLVWCPSGSPPGEPILIWNPSWSYRCPSWSLLVGLVPRLGLTRLQTTQDPSRGLSPGFTAVLPLSWVTLDIVGIYLIVFVLCLHLQLLRIFISEWSYTSYICITILNYVLKH